MAKKKKSKKVARTAAPQKKTAAQKAGRKAAVAKSAWVVTTSGDRAIADVAKDLSAAGFKIDQTLEQIGIITGKSADKNVGKARAVRGVADVSPDHKVDIGPPNSRETW
jgi:hypothetical protein